MAWLTWIEDGLLVDEVQKLLSIAKKAQTTSTSDFNKNVIDPFAALFEMAGFEIHFETWKKNEITRQAQKTLQNHIGNFHQNILGHVQGWENLNTKQVVDLKSDRLKIVAEVKNKYNTVSGGKLSDFIHLFERTRQPKSEPVQRIYRILCGHCPGKARKVRQGVHPVQ